MGKRSDRQRRGRAPGSTRPKSPASILREVEPPSDFRTFAWQLAGICALALFLRLLHVTQTFQVPTVVRLLGDAKGYLTWASAIAQGNWFGDETFYQAPLYPYFLAVLIKCFGPSITGIRVVQSLMAVAGVALIGLGGRKMFTPRIGLIGAIMLAIYPPAIYYDGIVQKASLASALLCALLAACVYLQDKQRLWLSVLAGVLLGLLVVTRENALLWVPILPAWIALGLTSLSRTRRLQLAAGCVLGIALILFPVAARNAHFGGQWSPSTFQAGPNFYIGNNLNARGIYQPLVPGRETPLYERADAQHLAEQAAGRTLSPREVSRFWMERSLSEIAEDPIRWSQLMVVKTLMVINRYEVPDVESMYVFRLFSTPLSLFRWWHFGTLFPLGIWGLLASRSQWRRFSLHYLLILTMAAAVVLFYVMGRYRLPLAILLMPFAAAGLVDLIQRLSPPTKQSLTAIMTLLVVVLMSNIRIHEEKSLNASSFMNLGIAAGQSGDLVSSIHWLQLAVDAFPDSPEAHFNLGRAFSINGQSYQAIASFQSAIELRPEIQMADYYLGEAYEKLGELGAAEKHYRRALQLDPQDQRARMAIGRLSATSQ